LKTLQTYIIAVSRYRLHLFHQYTQSNESCEQKDLLHVRKEILHRFQLVINELEQTMENFQAYRISDNDVQFIVNQPSMKEVVKSTLFYSIIIMHDL
jgi:isoleucyl-tRNA synthetase